MSTSLTRYLTLCLSVCLALLPLLSVSVADAQVTHDGAGNLAEVNDVHDGLLDDLVEELSPEDAIEFLLAEGAMHREQYLEDSQRSSFDSITEAKNKYQEALDRALEIGQDKLAAEALYALGKMALYGEDEIQLPNIVEASSLFHQASEKGHSASQFTLSVLYANGLINGFMDEQASLAFATFAAMNGDLFAKALLGFRYMYGRGLRKSCKQATNHYFEVGKNVIKQLEGVVIEPVRDKTRLSEDSIKGKSKESPTTPEEEEYAIEMYKELADGGNAQAQVTLGQVHLFGIHGQEANPQLAARYFQAAADQGSPEALAQLGVMHSQGVGVDPNPDVAYDYLSQASEHGSVQAKNALAVMHLRGNGAAEKNVTKAIELFNSAIAKGDKQAAFNLASLYYTGSQGVSKDINLAYHYFHVAADRGNTRAQFNVGLMYHRGLGPSNVSCHRALPYIKKVVDQGNWIELLEYAHDDFDAGLIESAVLRYMMLAEMGIELAQSNVAFIMNDESYSHAWSHLDETSPFSATHGTFSDDDVKEMGWIDNKVIPTIDHENANEKANANENENERNDENNKVITDEITDDNHKDVPIIDSGSDSDSEDEDILQADYRQKERTSSSSSPSSSLSSSSRTERPHSLLSTSPTFSSNLRRLIAKRHFMMAADQGNAEASRSLGDFAYYSQDPDRLSKSFQLYQQASTRGSKRAHFNLAYMYQQGLGVEQSIERARNLYARAAAGAEIPLVIPPTLALSFLDVVQLTQKYISDRASDMLLSLTAP